MRLALLDRMVETVYVLDLASCQWCNSKLNSRLFVKDSTGSVWIDDTCDCDVIKFAGSANVPFSIFNGHRVETFKKLGGTTIAEIPLKEWDLATRKMNDTQLFVYVDSMGKSEVRLSAKPIGIHCAACNIYCEYAEPKIGFKCWNCRNYRHYRSEAEDVW